MNSTIQASQHNPVDPSAQQQLVDCLHRLTAGLRGQCRGGWDINVMQHLHTKLGTLVASCNRLGQIEIAEQLLALETTLGPALTRSRTPDSGSSALVAALCDHLHNLIPSAGGLPQPAARVKTHQASTPEHDEIRVLLAGAAAQNAAKLGGTIKGTPGFVTRHISEPLVVLEELSKFAPDLILLDLHMTVCGSQELASMIKERPDFADIPILYVAADESAVTCISDVLPVSMPRSDLLSILRREVAAVREAGAHAPVVSPHQRRQHRRAWLLDRLENALSNGKNQKGGLLDINLDHLDTLMRDNSRPALQLMHKQLGNLIGESMESGDMLADNGAGYLLLCRERSREGMHALADELHGRINRERFGPSALPLSVSIGGCLLNNGLDLVDTVLRSAQRAREAAEPGQVGWHHHGDGCIDPLQLENALRNNRVHLVYQAIVNLSSTHLPRYQALLRLRDNDGFVHTAAELLPVAQRSGLTTMLDRWSLDQCLTLLAEHQRQTRPLHLFISQSNESLQERDYPAWLAQRLNLRGVRSSRLVLEFHCDDISKSPRELMRAAARIKALGVGLCLSGVNRSLGTAQLLDTLPLDYIKLVPGLNAHPGALIPIAHARNMAVIATQVEDPALLRKLESAGVDSAQGHSLAHPARALSYTFQTAAAG